MCSSPKNSKWFGVKCLHGGIAWLACMQNVGALRMLGECSVRCHLEIWSLGQLDLKDVPCMGMVRNS
jgi:hypothetical protein